MAIDLRKLLFMQQAQNEQNQNNLLSTNQAQSGLLGSLMGDPTARLLIGANILGAGIKGSDPFSAITPAVLQTAQIQKALRPKSYLQEIMLLKILIQQHLNMKSYLQVQKEKLLLVICQ